MLLLGHAVVQISIPGFNRALPYGVASTLLLKNFPLKKDPVGVGLHTYNAP